MKRVIAVAGMLAILISATTLVGDDKTPTIAEIMTRAHKKNKLRDQIKAGLDRSSPEWESIGKKSKEFYTLASALEKNESPFGDKESWKKLSKEYAEAVKGLDDAVAAKDQKAGRAALNKLATRCLECHKLHRE